MAAKVVATLALMSTMSVFVDHATASAVVLKRLPVSTQFDITGFLQVATLDQACVTAAGANVDANGFPQAAHCGGGMTLNGHSIVVPNETIVILPASALTWQELFAFAPAPYGPTQTGMAMADLPTPLTTYEVQAVGNRVLDPGNADPTKRDRYIAGLVHISQQDLNAGAGYINYMDYATGEMRVGGIPNDPTTGARVQINDPAVGATGTGRYGRAMSPDVRFQVDQDNPTIASATGFPMCFPRVDPATAVDPLCPQTQRALDVDGSYAATYTMSNPNLLPPLPAVSPLDPRVQAPFEVGDYVNYAGTVIADNPADPASTTYISAHTIIANVAIRTVSGTNPVYVSIEVGIMGTGGVTDPGLTEASVRSRFEGMSTDITRTIHLYGIAVQPDGSTIEKDLGTQALDPAAAVPGRWRFRPPCFPFGTTPQNDPKFKPLRDCVFGFDANGPAPREVRAVVEGVQSQVTDEFTTANGIIWGQYHAPIGEYIFPENTPGAPIPANNFENVPFLSGGGYSSVSGVVAGQLNPWPGVIMPPVPCVAPVASAGGPYNVGSGATVTLAASSTGTNPTFAWTAAPAGSLSALNIPNPVFLAPTAGGPVTLSLTVTNACGSSTKTATVNVSSSLAPSVSAVPAVTITSGNPGTIVLTGSDPNAPASTPLTFAVAQTGNPALTGVSMTRNSATSETWHFTAPAGVTAPPKVIDLSITATNAAGVVSAPVTTTVTINPVVAGQAPVANAGGPYTVNSGSTITLAGSATGTPTLNFDWTAPAAGQGDILGARNIPNPVYRAPSVAVDTVVNLTITVTNNVGPTGTSTSTSIATINVAAARPPVVNPVAAQSVISSAPATFTVTGTDPNSPPLPLTFQFVSATQTAGPALPFTPVAIGNPSSTTSATVSFAAPTLPPAQVTNNVYDLRFTATNNLNLTSTPVVVTVTVKPIPDIISITDAEYRTGKQRLILSATSNDPTAVLKLLPYARLNGGTFDPALLGVTFTNAGAGLWTLTLVGAPQPAAGAVLQITSARGALSPMHALDRIRA